MNKLIRCLYASTAIVGAALAPQAHAQATVAATLDFETVSPSDFPLYFAGESFSQNGYTMTVLGDSALVDVAESSGPSLSNGKFYSQLNAGSLFLERTDGSAFSLQGFSFAFLPLSPAAGQQTAIVAFGETADAAPDARVTAYLFPNPVSGRYPFGTASGSAFASFTNLRSVEFFACPVSGSSLACATSLQNNGQFALDDIQVTGLAAVTAVPEPTTALLLALGLAVVAVGVRRNRA